MKRHKDGSPCDKTSPACVRAHVEFNADLHDELARLRAELVASQADAMRLRAALVVLTAEPGGLSYPIRDVYGSSVATDRAAPLWTEAGLYGRVGKEAARTLLARHRRAVEAIVAAPFDDDAVFEALEDGAFEALATRAETARDLREDR